MNAVEIVRGLDGLIERHKNDKYNSFETRWVDVVTDCKQAIQGLLTENNGLKRKLEEYEKEAGIQSSYAETVPEKQLEVFSEYANEV